MRGWLRCCRRRKFSGERSTKGGNTPREPKSHRRSRNRCGDKVAMKERVGIQRVGCGVTDFEGNEMNFSWLRIVEPAIVERRLQTGMSMGCSALAECRLAVFVCCCNATYIAVHDGRSEVRRRFSLTLGQAIHREATQRR
jgi:hypothetical protein